jgi:hypothetical protein
VSGSEQDMPVFYVSSEQRAAEEHNAAVEKMVAAVEAGNLDEARAHLEDGMFKEWKVSRHSDADPATVWAAFCERVDRYGGAA